MNALCLVVDGLNAAYLGAYGAGWVGTPRFDKLAAEGTVFDSASIDTTELPRLYRSLWTGAHALQEMAADVGLPQASTESGTPSILLTDEPRVAEHPLSRGFAERRLLNTADVQEPAGSPEETAMAGLFAEAVEWLGAAPEKFCLWLHSRGMYAPWDAPRELRQRYVEEGDPEAPEFLIPPVERLAEEHDPDHTLGVRRAYAAQVAVLDFCVGAVLDALEESGLAATTLVAVFSSGGYPLGVHGRIGCPDGRDQGPLDGERTSAALLLRIPGAEGALRSNRFVQPGDLAATLCGWLGVDSSQGFGRDLASTARGEESIDRDRLLIVTPGGERSLLTPAWRVRIPADGGAAELYRKPDDRWEINDVADRCPEAVALGREAIEDLQRRYAAGQFDDLPPLDDVLARGVE